MHQPIRFAIVGCGYIGQRHAAIIRQNPDAQLVAMADTNPSLRKAIEATYQVPFFESMEEMLAAGLPIDVVNICSPNWVHTSQSLLALDSGYHVVCEKPMGLSKTACQQVYTRSLDTQKLFACVMQNRYSPPAIWLKELLENRVLGDIYMVQINCYWNRDERYYKKDGWKGRQHEDGGTLFTQFSHFVDMMYWLFGDIKNIQASFADFNHSELTDFEDSGMVQFEFEQGGMGSFHYSTAVWSKNMESSLTIVAEKGSVRVGGQYFNTVEYCHIKDYTLPELAPTLPPNEYGTHQGSAANHEFVIANVIDTLRNKSRVTTNAHEGMKVVDIIERIYALRNLPKLNAALLSSDKFIS
jgi:UDP-N-acetyl-2-amino-2-deoxyglucuronate dehydrogenase